MNLLGFTKLFQEPKKILREGWGEQHQDIPRCNLLLADLARERDELDVAKDLHQQAHDWAIARDAKESLCWSAWVRGRIALTEARQQEDFSHGPEASRLLAAARASIEEGLRIARDCGFGIYHIDLLTLRAQVSLHESNAETAERDARVALSEGVHPPEDSGLPTLLAATDEECGYAWGEGDARHLLAEAYLLQAAQTLGESDFAPARFDTLPDEVKTLIEQAREALTACRDLRKRIQDPKIADTEHVLKQLKGGVLTTYPLEPLRAAEEAEEPPKPVRDQVFISYAHKDKAWLERFQKMLAPLVRTGAISLWDDTTIRVGQKWDDEIKNALARAKVALLLVSDDFLASDFIAKKELPPLLRAAEQDGLTIAWAYIGFCIYEVTEINDYQAAHDIKQPLEMLPEAEQNKVIKSICKKIHEAVKA